MLFGDFSILSKLNRYLRSVLQGEHQSVIVVDGNVVDHSVPELFVELDGRSFKFGQFKEHTADGNRLGISLLALCRETFELFLLGAEAVGEVIVTTFVLFATVLFTQINTKRTRIIPINAKILFRKH